jgi:hypothetical protein
VPVAASRSRLISWPWSESAIGGPDCLRIDSVDSIVFAFQGVNSIKPVDFDK